MDFVVRGVHKTTGKDVKKRYAAGSEEAVRILAREDGVMVERIDLHVDRTAAALESMAPAPVHRPTPPASVEYAWPSTNTQAPDYTGLRVAGFILRVYAYLLYAGGVIFFAIGIVVALTSSYSQPNNPFAGGPPAQTAAAFLALLPALAMLVAGGIAHGIGAGCIALRDIAVNSWRR